MEAAIFGIAVKRTRETHRYSGLSFACADRTHNGQDSNRLGIGAVFAYNFIKIHRTLRVSPAMAAGVTDRLWSVEDLGGPLGVLRAAEDGKSGIKTERAILRPEQTNAR